MKISIIGAGAMGCLYGARLSENLENEITLIDVWEENVQAINSDGILLEEAGKWTSYGRIKATAGHHTSLGHSDLAIIFVKSMQTRQAVLGHKAVFGPNTVALTLQNGLGNIDIIGDAIGSEKVIAGTTAHGATMLGPGKARHAGFGKTVIGELDGSETPRIRTISEIFNKAGIETHVSGNVLGLVWDKLLVNVGINALTGISKLRNGEILQHKELEEILEMAVSEATAVAKAKGIQLGYEDPVAHAKEICLATSSNKSSMLQDLLNHKQTEIDMINGAISREGEKLGIKTPVNRILANLIKFLEK